MTQATQQRKQPFSSFTYKEAFKHLGIAELKRWTLTADPLAISDFFRQRLERLQRFDLESLEVSKTLLIDAICEEGLEGFKRLKVWKGAYLEGETACGNAGYLIAERRGYLEAPFACVIEAKKDSVWWRCRLVSGPIAKWDKTWISTALSLTAKAGSCIG